MEQRQEEHARVGVHYRPGTLYSSSRMDFQSTSLPRFRPFTDRNLSTTSSGEGSGRTSMEPPEISNVSIDPSVRPSFSRISFGTTTWPFEPSFRFIPIIQ